MQASIRFVLGNYHPIILVNVQARVALVLLGFHALDQRSLSLVSVSLHLVFEPRYSCYLCVRVVKNIIRRRRARSYAEPVSMTDVAKREVFPKVIHRRTSRREMQAGSLVVTHERERAKKTRAHGRVETHIQVHERNLPARGQVATQ